MEGPARLHAKAYLREIMRKAWFGRSHRWKRALDRPAAAAGAAWGVGPSPEGPRCPHVGRKQDGPLSHTPQPASHCSLGRRLDFKVTLKITDKNIGKCHQDSRECCLRTRKEDSGKVNAGSLSCNKSNLSVSKCNGKVVKRCHRFMWTI